MSAGSIIIDLLMNTGSFETDTARAERRMQEFGKRVKQVSAAVGTAVVGAGVAFAASMKSIIDRADETEKSAQRLGMTGEALTGLRHAADLSGVSQQKLSESLSKLNKAAAEGNDAFDAIGISVTDANGKLKSSDQLIKDVASKFAGYADGAAKFALAQRLFGETGAELIPLLNAGADGISAMQVEAAALGLVLDQDTRKAAEAFNDNLTRLNRAQEGITTQISAQMLPTMLNLSDRLVAVAKDSDTMAYASRTAATALKLLLSAGILIGATFKTVGEAVGATAAAVVMAAQGNFKGAWETLKAGASDVAANVRGAMSAVDAVWDESAAKAKAIASDPDRRPDAPLVAAAAGAKRSASVIDKAAKDALRAQERMMAEGRRVFDATRTPAEQLAAEIERLNGLLQGGAIDWDTYSRAVFAAQDSFDSTVDAAKRAAEQQEAARAAARDSLYSGLLTEEEELLQSYERRRAAILAATEITELERQDLLTRLNEKFAADEKSRQDALVQAQYQAYAGLFDGLAGLMKAYQGEQSSAYRALFAISKAFAIADAMMKVQQAIANAAASGPFPWNLGAMASVASAVGGVVSAISSVSFGGARADGGNVSSDRRYLVGERGPEMFVPNTAGTIVPNDVLMGGRGEPPVVNIRNVNAFDTSAIGDYMGSDAGEQVILNVVRRNRSVLE